MLKIYDLRCDNKTMPLGVNSRPTFSFKIESDFSYIQSGYQLVVANKNGVCWDSGRVNGSSTCGIVYEGNNLESATDYTFHIISFGFNVLTREAHEVESEQSGFETALLDGFKAKWVGLPAHFSGTAIFLRNIKKLSDHVKKARIYFCGLGYSEIYVNGQKLSSDVLSPDFTDYTKNVHYVVYDATACYKKGENITSVWLADGWFGSRQMMCQIEIELENGEMVEILSGFYFDWFVTKSPILRQSIYEGETYDARREELIAGFDGNAEEIYYFNKGWMFSVSANEPSGKLSAAKVEPIQAIRNIPYIRSIPVDTHVWVYDMGQIFAGWVVIKVKGEKGSKVTLKYGEGLLDDGRINQLNLRSADSMDTYILKGEGEESYAPRFTYHGFGFVEVETFGDVEIIDLFGQLVRNNVKKIGEFECSNPVINQIHKNAVITEESNLHSIPTDCPQRDERFGWLNDITSRLDQAFYNFDESLFYEKFLQDITDTQDDCGRITDTAPFKIGMRPADPVVVSYPLIAQKLYSYYGNVEPLKEQYDQIKKWVDYLDSRRVDGLLSFGYYGDWAPPIEFSIDGTPCNRITPVEMVSGAYFYWYCQQMANFAKILNKESDKEKYIKLSEETKFLYNQKYFNYEKGYYGQNSQSGNAIPLNLGLCPAGFEDKVVKNIIQDLKSRDFHLTTGNQGYKHMLEILTKMGYVNEAYQVVTNPTYPGWGFMIANLATSIWERWEAEMKNEMNSYCHPMLGSVDSWFYAYLAGIQFEVDSVGCDKLILQPYFVQDITYVRSSFNSPRGLIVSNWKKEGAFIHYYFVIPATALANVKICGKILSVNGNPFDGQTVFYSGQYDMLIQL